MEEHGYTKLHVQLLSIYYIIVNWNLKVACYIEKRYDLQRSKLHKLKIDQINTFSYFIEFNLNTCELQRYPLQVI